MADQFQIVISCSASHVAMSNIIPSIHKTISRYTQLYMWLDLQKPSLTAQEMKSCFLLIITPTLLHYLEIIKHIVIDGQVCFHWRFIVNPVKPPWCNTGSLGPVNGINKDATGAKLLPTTASTCPVDWVTFCYLLKTQHCCLCPYGRFNPIAATHSPPSST